jgi:hypothetical protein
MLDLKLRNHVEEIPKLFRVVERLNDKFDSFELYHHSTSGQISELEYIAIYTLLYDDVKYNEPTRISNSV